MPAYRRILVAVDFSSPTVEVLAAAEAFAKRFDAALDMLHVLPLRETDVKEAEAQLDAYRMSARVSSRRVLRAVTAELGILEVAKQGGADLVVVGTHGRTGLPHIRLGSVAARVVEMAPVPVLAVRRSESRVPAEGGPMVSFTRILCPVDFSEHSKAALTHAEDVARKFGAELTLMHVVEPILYPVAYGLPPVSPVDYEQVARDSASKALATLASEVSGRGTQARARVESGTASQRICEVAKADGHDLIVLATHGYTGLKHVLLGSTAERVVRFAPCAVLVVKAAQG